MRKVEHYLSLPWTIVPETHDDDGEYFSVTISELPGFIVAAETRQGLDDMFWPALEEFILSYLRRGEDPPVPVRRGETWVLSQDLSSVHKPETESAGNGAQLAGV